MPLDGTKRCTKCGETKPAGAFSADARKRTGLQSSCKACAAAYRAAHADSYRVIGAAYYAANAERILAREVARFAADPELVRRKQVRDAARYAANAERIKEQAAAWRAANADRYRACRAARRAELTEQNKAYRDSWRAANRDKVLAYGRRRRARKAGVRIRDFTAAQWMQIKAVYGHRCVYCGIQPAALTQDHLVPLARGGNHTASNIVPACVSCNARKQDRPPPVPVQPVLFA